MNTVALALSGLVMGALPFTPPTFHLALHVWRDGHLVAPFARVHF